MFDEVAVGSRFALSNVIHLFFCKQLESGLSPQSCLYFQGFWGSKLLNGCFVVWQSDPYLRGIEQFSGFKIDIYDQWL